jgi:N-acetylglucosaminyldiphosphoundecaprenol N-acetyl-beta-D-mannosaminyltransferase
VDRVNDRGKRNVLGVLVDAVDRDAAIERVVAAAIERRPYAVSALAVHGVMEGVHDPGHAYRLNRLDLVTPDGQPVRWALNILHGTALRERVYGPDLMRGLCDRATTQGIGVYLYGGRPDTVARLRAALERRYPGIRIAGAEPSRFRRLSDAEVGDLAARVRDSGAGIVFVGLGCPRQEVFVYELRDSIGVPMVAVGAAFDYLAGDAVEPPAVIQRAGLQWLYRLIQEPRRLWRRYTLLNVEYMGRLALQYTGLSRPHPSRVRAPETVARHG